MKPKPSPLECLGYWVVELSVVANPDRDAASPPELDFGDLRVEADSLLQEDAKTWRVCVRIKQQLPRTRNAPYNFAAAVLGDFRVSPSYPQDRAECLVRTNAPSILYGVARELLRTTMSAGPYDPVLLPTVSFYEPVPKADAAAVPVPTVPGAKPRRRKSLPPKP